MLFAALALAASPVRSVRLSSLAPQTPLSAIPDAEPVV